MKKDGKEYLEEFRIGERAESDHLEIALGKRRGEKRIEKERGGGIGIKLFIFIFLCTNNN
jgi:uncharacterized protein YjaZ